MIGSLQNFYLLWSIVAGTGRIRNLEQLIIVFLKKALKVRSQLYRYIT
ncbi:hypothetical protein QUB75_09990 [Microcoleus sp. K1-B6]|nr:hypothetical protein [Microcoleus sp.]